MSIPPDKYAAGAASIVFSAFSYGCCHRNPSQTDQKDVRLHKQEDLKPDSS